MNELVSYANIVYDHLSDDERIEVYRLHHKLEKYESKVTKSITSFKVNKRVIGLKYQSIKNRVNTVQISVIIVSTCLTFIETIKEYFHTYAIIERLIPIILSTYVALVLSISRFYRYDEIREQLSKLDEKQAFVLNRLKGKRRLVRDNLPITKNVEVVEAILNDFDKDGLDEVITQTFQESDIILSYKERLYYENALSKLEIDSIILKHNMENIDTHVLALPLNKYKKRVSTWWYYLTCAWSGEHFIIDDREAFRDADKI